MLKLWCRQTVQFTCNKLAEGLFKFYPNLQLLSLIIKGAGKSLFHKATSLSVSKQTNFQWVNFERSKGWWVLAPFSDNFRRWYKGHEKYLPILSSPPPPPLLGGTAPCWMQLPTASCNRSWIWERTWIFAPSIFHHGKLESDQRQGGTKTALERVGKRVNFVAFMTYSGT